MFPEMGALPPEVQQQIRQACQQQIMQLVQQAMMPPQGQPQPGMM
jgi:hypothetical protein